MIGNPQGAVNVLATRRSIVCAQLGHRQRDTFPFGTEPSADAEVQTAVMASVTCLRCGGSVA